MTSKEANEPEKLTLAPPRVSRVSWCPPSTAALLENETRRLIGWLPGEPGGRAVGEGARGEPEGTPEREGNSSSNHLLSSGGQIAKLNVSVF